MASLSSVDLQALTRQVRAILDDPHAPAPSTGTPTLVQSQTAWLELPHTEGYETHTTPLRPSTRPLSPSRERLPQRDAR